MPDECLGSSRAWQSLGTAPSGRQPPWICPKLCAPRLCCWEAVSPISSCVKPDPELEKGGEGVHALAPLPTTPWPGRFDVNPLYTEPDLPVPRTLSASMPHAGPCSGHRAGARGCWA